MANSPFNPENTVRTATYAQSLGMDERPISDLIPRRFDAGAQSWGQSFEFGATLPYACGSICCAESLIANEPRRDRQLPLGRRGSDPRHIQAWQIPGCYPATDCASPPRLRARADQGKGPAQTGRAQRQETRGPRSAAQADVRFRLLQHLALRLRQAPRRCAAPC